MTLRIFWRRAAYLLCLLGTFAFYIFNTSYFSWLLFAVFFLLPAISVLAAIPLVLGTRVILEAQPKEALAPAGFTVDVRAVSNLGVRPVRLRLQFENRFSGERAIHKVKLVRGESAQVAYTGDICGLVRCGVARPRTTDLLGIIWLPLRRQAGIKVLHHPEVHPFPREVNDAFTPEESDRSEVRDYRAGDPLRDVHWKLSARHERLIVRESAPEAGWFIQVGVRWQGDARELSQTLGRLEGLMRHLDGRGLPYRVDWEMATGVAQTFPADSHPGSAARQDTPAGMLRTLLARPAPGNAAQAPGPAAGLSWEGRVLLAAPEAILLYENGAQKGAFV